jgi:gliding motility-associated-like protein
MRTIFTPAFDIMKKTLLSGLLVLTFLRPALSQKNQSISGGNTVSSMVCANKQVYFWGAGQPTPTAAVFPGGLTISQVSSGSGGHYVATDCNGAVWSWGNNTKGQLGNGTCCATTTAPAKILASAAIPASNRNAAGELINVNFVYSGNNNSYAVLNDGKLVSWGGNDAGSGAAYDNNSGQLGNGNTTNQYSAGYVINGTTGLPLTGVTEVFAGDNVTYALVGSTVYSWGAGLNGTLGRDATGSSNPSSGATVISNKAYPVVYAAGTTLGDGTIAGAGRIMNNITHISCGDVFGMALDANGYVWSWGNGAWNNSTGSTTANYTGSDPRRVLKGSTTGGSNDGTYLLAKQIGGGQGYGMAVTADGKPVAWGGGGCGDGGATGNGTLTGSGTTGTGYILRSAGVVDNNVIAINRGDLWGSYQTSDNKIYTWGCNAGGVLGIGNTTNQAYAVPLVPPAACGFRDPVPTAKLTPRDTTVCESKFTSLKLNSGFVIDPSIASYYTLKWYKDKAPTATGTPVLTTTANLSTTYTATSKGKYNVEVSYTGPNAGCTPYDVAKDSMTITVYPQTFTAPTNLTYCTLKPAKVNVISTSTTNAGYDFFPDATSTTVLGSSIGSASTSIDLTTATASGTDRIVYAEEKAYASGSVMKKAQGCDPTWFANNDFVNPGAGPDNTQTGFTITEPVSIDSLSLMIQSDIYNAGNSYAGNLMFGIYGSKAVNGGVIADATKKIGAFSYAFNRTRSATDPQTVGPVEVRAPVGIKLLTPGTYFFTLESFSNVTGSGGLKVGRGGCAPTATTDDVPGSPNIINYAATSATYSNVMSPAAGRFFNINFKTLQHFCDRIPITIKQKCPCQQPATVTVTSAPAPAPKTATAIQTVSVCMNTPVNLSGAYTPGTNPLVNSIQYVWYKSKTTPVPADYKAVPIAGKPFTTALADSGVWVLRVEDGTAGNKSCYLEDSIHIVVDSLINPGIIATDQKLCAGQPVNPLTSTKKGSGGNGKVTYSWELSVDGGTTYNTIPGATSITYAPPTPPATAPSVISKFRRITTSGTAAWNCPAKTTAPVTITVNKIPADPAVPVAGASPACITTTLTNTVPAGETYFWQAAGTPADSLRSNKANPLTVTTSNTYYVRASNDASLCWSTNSNKITIVINQPVVPGVIAADQSQCGGSGAAFTPNKLTSTTPASVGDGTTYTYTWEQSTDGGTTWVTATPAGSAVDYQPGPLTQSTFYRRKVVSGVCPVQYSNIVKITLGAIPADPTAITGVTPACPSTSLTIGAAPATDAYFWQGTVSVGTDITKPATTAYPVSVSGTYYARAQNTTSKCWSLGSSSIVIVINPLTAGTIGDKETVCQGTTPKPLKELTPGTGGTGTLAYQWQATSDTTVAASWADEAGATTQTAYALPTPTATKFYRRKVTSGTCVNQTYAVAKIFSPLPGPAIAPTGPSPVCAGTTAQTYSTTPVAGISYNWTKPAGTKITSATADSSSITVTIGTTDGAFTVTPYNSCGKGTPASLPIQVKPILTPTVTIDGPIQICAGGNASFSISASNYGGTGPSYDWYLTKSGGTPSKVSATNSYTSTTLQNGDAIQLVMTSSEKCVSSPTASSNTLNITVVTKVVPSVKLNPDKVCAGVSQEITAQAKNPGSNPIYEWTVNGVSKKTGTGLDNKYSQIFANNDVVAVKVTSDDKCAVAPDNVATDTKTITVLPVPVATSNNPQICSGNSVDILLVSSVSPGTTYAWSTPADPQVTGIVPTGTTNLGNEKISQNLSLISSVTTTKVLTYTITPTADICTGSPITSTITIYPIPDVIATGAPVCDGSSNAIALTSSVSGATFTWKATGSSSNLSGFGDDATGTKSNIAQTLSNTGSTPEKVTYNVIASNSSLACKSLPFPVVTTVNPTPKLTPVTQADICSGSQTNIALASTVSGATYSWTSSGAGVTGSAGSGTTSPIAETLTNAGTANATLTYTVAITANSCPGTPTPIPVVVKPIPVGTATVQADLCGGNPTNITLGPASPATFTWTVATTGTVTAPSPTLSGSPIAQVLVNGGSSPGTAVFTITPMLNGCPGSPFTSNTINVNPAPIATVTSPPDLCSGDNSNIVFNSGTPGTIFNWTSTLPSTVTTTGTATSPSNTIVQPYTNTGASNATVSFTVTPFANNCSGQPVPFTLIVKPIPVATATNANPSFCSGGSTSITLNSATSGTTFGVAASGGAGSISLSGQAIGAIISQALSATAKTDVVYTITPTAFNCPGSPISKTVSVYPIPVSNAGGVQHMCIGDSVKIGSPFLVDYKYSWSPKTGLNNDTLAAPISKATAPTVYTVTTTLRAFSCSTTDNATVNVGQKFTVEAGPDVLICAKEQTILNATPAGLVSYVWNNGASGSNITIAPEKTAIYIVTASNGDCFATDSVTVNIKNVAPPTLYIPNSFSPNEDGLNETFQASGESIVAFEGVIMNRWGEKIYEWKDIRPEFGWDGKMPSSKVQEDVYVYSIRVKNLCEANFTKPRTGTVTILH